MKKFVSVLLMIVMLFVLTACESTGEDLDAVKENKWEIPFAGLGIDLEGVTFGMTQDQVTEILGQPDEVLNETESTPGYIAISYANPDLTTAKKSNYQFSSMILLFDEETTAFSGVTLYVDLQKASDSDVEKQLRLFHIALENIYGESSYEISDPFKQVFWMEDENTFSYIHYQSTIGLSHQVGIVNAELIEYLENSN